MNSLDQVHQKYLGEKGFIIFIAFISAFIPLSTDLYLPALPHMAENFGAPPSLVNLTLVLFFIFYALGTLFWGPLSDKYGRKKILMTGLFIYVSASILCALSQTIVQLIVCRILQAMGSGAVIATGTAIIKDTYDGKKRLSALAVVQSMVMIAPIVAPLIGAWLLGFTSWRGIFGVLAFFGFLAFLGGLIMEETLVCKSAGNIGQALGRLLVVLKNSRFASMLLTFSLIGIPMMAYVSISSYIYQDGFGLSERAFSFFFASNAVFAVIAPLISVQLSKWLKCRTIITASYVFVSLAGVSLCVFGHYNPWLFALSIIPGTLANGIIRPQSTNLMLEEVQGDTGSASSLINFTYTLFSSIGMGMISLNWPNRILVLGLMYGTIGLVCLTLWLIISKRLHAPKPVQEKSHVMLVPLEDEV